MGKNKKKDKKEKTGQPAPQQDAAASLPIASLAVSDSPSTSQDTEAVAVTPAPGPASAPTPGPAPPATAEPEPEEDGGLGLGLGEGKRRPKKKPKAQKKQTDAGQGAPGQERGPGQPTPEPSARPPGDVRTPPSQPTVQAPGPWMPPPASGVGPPLQTARQGQPQQAPGVGPPKQMPGFGPPAQTPVQTPGQTQGPPGARGPQAPAAQHPQQKAGGPQRGQGDQSTSQALSKTTSRYVIPLRIDGNKVRARQIKMLVNYLAMRIKPMKVYRYDASFTPERPKKAIPQAFEATIKKNFPKFVGLVAFDQMKNFYSTETLPFGSNERFIDNIELPDSNGRMMKFTVSFKATGVVDYNTLFQHMTSGGSSLNPPTEAIQAIDVILRQGTLQSYVKAGRQFFKRPANPIALGEGLEMWTGLFQSAIFTSRPFINIDVAHKGFPIYQPLMQVLNAFRLDPKKPVDSQRGFRQESFLHFLKGLRVVARVGGDAAQKREYICNSMVEPADRQRFLVTDDSGKDRQLTVADYFREKGCRLQYPNQNCIWVGPKEKSIYYPMEVLEVAYGQVRNRQLSDEQLRTMVREAATPPNERKRKIEEVIRDMNYSNNPYFKKFGLEISDKFTEVNGKVLDVPRMECGAGAYAMPRRGAWQSEKVLLAKTMDNWGIIAMDMDPRTANVEQLESMFQSVGRQMGMTVSAPTMRQANVAVPALERVMRTALERKLQMLVVVVSPRSRDVYAHVKKVAECSVGVLTQCITENTAARKCNMQTIRNILLKVNSKLMGINHALDNNSVPACMRAGNVMVVGADVTHPSPDQSHIPSIAAVTASIDKKCFKYNIEFSIQGPKREMIVEFEDMMVDHLKMYRDEQRALPAKIYVFRDGVSEGQFAQVMESELQAVYNAYARLSGTAKKPEVMFLLVQKRHHTRFFLGDSQNNVEPGTVVDSVIVHPKELDFYLVSHQAIKGTARPTRYHAVCNSGNLPHDEVEQLTFYLCHLYSRCTRSVSYPTPTYYAHLACLRARTLTLNEKFDNSKLEKQPVRLHVKPRIQEMSPMFFV